MDSKETTLLTALIISVVVIGTIIGYFFISLVRHQKNLLRLTRNHILDELSTKEKERFRIATDLHDELGPLIAVVQFKLQKIHPANSREVDFLQQATRDLDQLILRFHEISRNLVPPELLSKGWYQSVRQLLENVENITALKIHLNLKDQPPLNEMQSLHLYRIVQEVIHNSLKHAQASGFWLETRYEKQLLSILARDNGKGFAYMETFEKNKGLGIQSLENRILLLQGHMQAESKPGKGTAYLFQIKIL